MRSKSAFSIWVVAIFMVSSYSGASTVFETIDLVRWIDFFRYSFTTDVEPYTYQVTLNDLNIGPNIGF